MAIKGYDFSGWATKSNLRCSDGRTIMKDAFKDCDGASVPLVWNHSHNDPNNVLGHAVLENREDGVYAYGFFNEAEAADVAKILVKHGDISSLSIYANKLREKNGNVYHGTIREVSLVLAGANPGASIDTVIAHSDEADEEAVIYNDEETLETEVIEHSEAEETEKVEGQEDAELEHAEGKEKTVADVIETMNDEQKKVLFGLLNMMSEEQDKKAGEKEESKEEENDMKHNIFEHDEMEEGKALTHSEMATIIGDAKHYGSMKESFLAHAAEYGIENLEYLFPEDRNLDTPPQFISREMDWVTKVMGAVHHSPFSRVKSMFADITEDQARAKGYIKGKLKKEEVFSLLKRSTSPTTIYKKQKMDRDDVIDITDFDVISWLKTEMRMMLNEELARAYLLGDGRLASDDDKISEEHIRPVVNDADLFVIRYGVAGNNLEDVAAAMPKAAIRARKGYKGSGRPTLFTTEDLLTEMLLLEDQIGHRLYKTETELATALRVSEIVTVPVMEDFKDKDDKDVYGIIVNLADYNVGADKGGAINMFDDFDIDYNQQKYLMETRCSGALTKPFSAIVLRKAD